MLWCERLTQDLSGPQLINDSKTPSGRAHVGSLRGVLIHDAVFRTLRANGREARYTYGVDDYDPLDELPAGRADEFRQHLGKPLCNVPPPDGSRTSDMAEHYIQEFFDVFSELGIEVEKYRMRDVYREGRFDEAIDRILNHGETVRRVYREVSGATRPDNWLPLQVICEHCGRIGTTEVTRYDGTLVDYECRRDLVKWAAGCGNRGRVTPFRGHAKLPWKLEWVAKWATFGVTVEGAGKDHTTRGGSREVASAALLELFQLPAPLNIPYEFFLVEGAKMSSSRGVGATAREVADLLTPEALRFVMLSTQPRRPVNFSLSATAMVKLYNDIDRLHAKGIGADDDAKLMRLCAPSGVVEPRFPPNFQLLVALVQIPRVDIAGEIAKRKGAPLVAADVFELDARLRVVKQWLKDYAPDDVRFEVQDAVPAAARALSHAKRAYLHAAAARLEHVEWDEVAVQTALFDVARLTPIDANEAFLAIYTALLGRDSGPKAGSLLSVLDRDFVLRRLRALPFSRRDFWSETSVSCDDFRRLIGDGALAALFQARLAFDIVELENVGGGKRLIDGKGVIEVSWQAQNKNHLVRVAFATVRALVDAELDADAEARRFGEDAREYLEDLEKQAKIHISLDKKVCVYHGFGPDAVVRS